MRSTKVRVLGVFVLVAATLTSARTEVRAEGRPGLSLRWTEATQGEASYLLADRAGVVAISEDGRVTHVAPNGSEEWTADVGDGRAVVFQDIPSLSDDLVVVPANEEDGVGLDRSTGRERWRVAYEGVHSTGAGTDAAGGSLAALVDRSGKLTVLDGMTGQARWSTQLPTFSDDFTHVWFGADRVLVQWTPTEPGSRFAAFDVATGALVWSREMPGASLPSVLGDSVLFAEMLEPWSDERLNPARVQSIDLASGAPRWATDIETRTVYFTFATSAAAGRSLAIVDLAGQVRLFDADDGTPRWKRATRRKQYEADLRIVGDVVAMSTYGTGLVALSTLDGQPVDTEPVGRVQYGVTIEGTAAAGDRLYLLVSRNGARDEAEVWAFTASR